MKPVLFQTSDLRRPAAAQDRQEEANGRRGVWFRGGRPPDRHLSAAALLVRITVGAEGRRDSPVGIGSVQGPGLLGLWLRSSYPPSAQDPRGPPSSRAPELRPDPGTRSHVSRELCSTRRATCSFAHPIRAQETRVPADACPQAQPIKLRIQAM